MEIGAQEASKCNTTTGDITECAKSIYENVKLIGTPGKVPQIDHKWTPHRPQIGPT